MWILFKTQSFFQIELESLGLCSIEQTCCYCGELEGACVECTEPACNRFFHITCGFVFSCRVSVKPSSFPPLLSLCHWLAVCFHSPFGRRMKHNVYLEYKESAGVGTDVVITLCHSHGRKWINRKDARCFIRSVKWSTQLFHHLLHLFNFSCFLLMFSLLSSSY